MSLFSRGYNGKSAMKFSSNLPEEKSDDNSVEVIPAPKIKLDPQQEEIV